MSSKAISLTYTIEARSYDLGGVASHNFWVLRDDEDAVVAQLHGLATDRKTNRVKPIGTFHDRLGFYEYRRINNDPNYISVKQPAVSIYQGHQDDVEACWDRAVSHIPALNQYDLNYSPFGVFGFPITNSNSAYHLFSQLMGIDCHHFPGVSQPGIRNALSYCQF